MKGLCADTAAAFHLDGCRGPGLGNRIEYVELIVVDATADHLIPGIVGKARLRQFRPVAVAHFLNRCIDHLAGATCQADFPYAPALLLK